MARKAMIARKLARKNSGFVRKIRPNMKPPNETAKKFFLSNEQLKQQSIANESSMA
ncbi:MAG: hypothetical protein U5R49_03710 [Deltaproteobacteria bacterium]|nr:hypothetical protein [Deltaproteobacteria bacterium]